MSTQLHHKEESELTRFFAMFPSPPLARDIFNIVEGHRVDSRLRVMYPGIKRDMAVVLTATLERRPDPATLPDAQAVVEVLLQHTMGAVADMSRMAPATRSIAQQVVELADSIAVDDSTVGDAARLTARLYEMIDDGLTDPRQWMEDLAEEANRQNQPQGGEGQDDDSASDPMGGGVDDYEAMDMPPFMTPVIEEMVKQRQAQENQQGGEQTDKEQAEGGEAPDDAKSMQTSEAQQGQGDQEDVAQSGKSETTDMPASPGSSPDKRTDDAESEGGEMLPSGDVQVPLVESQEEEEEDLGEQTFMYDEWDFRIEDFRPAWCTLREQRSTRQQEGFVAATFHEYGGIVSQIRRNFQLMRPERLRKMRFQPEGDDLDTDGLVEYVVDRRARVAPSGKVYIKRDKKDRDVTTAFLVDMSSSTDRKIDGRKRIMDIEKEALLLMCEALEAIRDEYAIYGFSGSGRDDCQFYVVKEIGERYDDRVKARIGGIYARQKTRMGPALRHATKRLMGVDSNVKLMILLTDGKPYDSDTYQDNQYAQEDTKMALREARREKIHLFCVTVDKEGADYLPHMYSDANFVIIDDVRTLPQRLPQLYRRLTT
jgi:nitric oxide reductase NorD protein